MTRVLLTGATGFIGSMVTRRLLQQGHTVSIVIRSGSATWRIEDVLPSLHVIWSDLTDSTSLASELAETSPDVAIHLAWYVESGEYLASPRNISMVAMTLGLASTLATVGCKRFVGIGTCFEYDLALGYLSETSGTAPSNMYAASKLACREILEHFHRGVGAEFAWLRLFYQYGPYEDSRRLVPSVICRLLRDQVALVTPGEQIRDYLHVADVASAISAVALSSVEGVVNIGSGKPVSIKELVTCIGETTRRSDLVHAGALPYRPGDPPFVCANVERLKSVGWEPAFTLRQGIENTVSWWRSRGFGVDDEP